MIDSFLRPQMNAARPMQRCDNAGNPNISNRPQPIFYSKGDK